MTTGKKSPVKLSFSTWCIDGESVIALQYVPHEKYFALREVLCFQKNNSCWRSAYSLKLQCSNSAMDCYCYCGCWYDALLVFVCNMSTGEKMYTNKKVTLEKHNF